MCYRMSTKSFQTEFIFTQKSGRCLAKAIDSTDQKEKLGIEKPVKFIQKNDKKAISSILKDFH